MSTNKPPSALIKNEAGPQSPSSSPSRVRVYGYDGRDFREPTSGSSSPQAASSPDLPQPPLQVHIHCYPSTQRNLQNVSGGNFPGRPHTIDNPSPSSSLNIVCILIYLHPLADFLIIVRHKLGQNLDTLTDAALSAAISSDATGGGILLQVSRNSERDTGKVFRFRWCIYAIIHRFILFRTENLPFPATVVTNDTKRRFKSKIASGERVQRRKM